LLAGCLAGPVLSPLVAESTQPAERLAGPA